MKHKQYPQYIAGIIAITGIFAIIAGGWNNLSHLDVPLTGDESFLSLHIVTIGFLLLAIAPIIVKRYLWSLIVLGIVAIYLVWQFVAQ